MADERTNLTEGFFKAVNEALENNNRERMEFLLSDIRHKLFLGVNINSQNAQGKTALHLSIRDCQDFPYSPEVTKLLLEKGARHDIHDNDGNIPLFLASLQNRTLSHLKLLLDAGADVNRKNPKSKQTCLMIACRAKKNEIVDHLLSCRGIEINAQDISGSTALHHHLFKHDDRHIITSLLNAGANPNIVDTLCNSPLHFAIHAKGRPNAVKILLQQPAIEINGKNIKGWTPLLTVIRDEKTLGENVINFIQQLRQKGVNINLPLPNGDTPLHLAVRAGRLDIALLLMKYHANLNCKNNENKTPYELSIIHNQEAIRLAIQTVQQRGSHSENVPPPPVQRQFFQFIQEKYSRCVNTLVGHTSDILDIRVLSNDNIVTASADKTIKIWDANNHQCLFTLIGHQNMVRGLAILSNNNIVSASTDGTIKIWDSHHGTCLTSIEVDSAGVNAVAVLSDEKIVSGGKDGIVRIWDVNRRACLQTFKGHRFEIYRIAIMKNGNIVSSSHDATIKIWDVNRGQCLQTLTGHTASVYGMLVLDDNTLISTSRDNTIKFWNINDGKCFKTLTGHHRRVFDVALLPDGTIVSGAHDNTLKIWDIKRGECLHTLMGHADLVSGVAVLKSGRIASISRDKTLKIWEWNPELKPLIDLANCELSLTQKVTQCIKDDIFSFGIKRHSATELFIRFSANVDRVPLDADEIKNKLIALFRALQADLAKYNLDAQCRILPHFVDRHLNITAPSDYLNQIVTLLVQAGINNWRDDTINRLLFFKPPTGGAEQILDTPTVICGIQ